MQRKDTAMDTTVNSDWLRNPAVLPPSEEEFHEINKDLGLRISDEDIKELTEYHKGTCDTYQRVYDLVEEPIPVKYPRLPGRRETDDPAWYWRCDIKGADAGLLVGKTVAVKDNVAVAGIPMMFGSKMMEGYTPEYDATIVTRILEQGGHILGKSTCEDMCFSGTSWTSCTGPVPNPFDPTRSAGGSSSGSGSLVARGIVDMAIGGDQGGSIRIPACWCGIVGMKPTHGLVPYTGICPIEITLDHTGPMARTVTECAALLEAMAGYDEGRDPRQNPFVPIPKYSTELDTDMKGKTIGLLKEGFEGVEEDYALIVRKAAERLRETGATVKDVSVPLHKDGDHIWTPVDYEGTNKVMLEGNGFGYAWKGHYSTSMQEFLTRSRNLRPADQSITVKSVALFSEYINRNYQNKFYAKAQNLTWMLTREYDKALKDCDVLVMPTLPGKPYKIPTKENSLRETFDLSFKMVRNTAPFNSTGHPALTINAGFSEGLPCGMMMVGRKYDDLSVLQIARAFEKLPKKQNVTM